MSGKPLKEITVSRARVLVGKALFGDDWIGQLSAAELRLLAGEHGFQRKELPNGRAINIIGKCPSHLRKKLDIAIGRSERAYVQHSTAIDVLHDAGFLDIARAYDAEKLDRLLTKLHNGSAESTRRRVGKPRDLREAIKRKMESDMRGGTDLRAMKQKELAAKYGGVRATAVKARQEVLEKHARE